MRANRLTIAREYDIINHIHDIGKQYSRLQGLSKAR